MDRQKLRASSAAPVSSTARVTFKIMPVMRTIPPTWGAEMDSCITQRSRRPIFLPENMLMITAMVTTPMPPIWIRHRMTICPNRVQYRAVSCRTRPVTQEAEVAVKRAVSSPAPRPSRVAKGSISSRVPSNIMARKLRGMI